MDDSSIKARYQSHPEEKRGRRNSDAGKRQTSVDPLVEKTQNRLENAAKVWSSTPFKIDANVASTIAKTASPARKADVETLTKIYRAYYKEGKRVSEVTTGENSPYNLATKGPSGYLRNPVTWESVQELIAAATDRKYRLSVQGFPSDLTRESLGTGHGVPVKFDNVNYPLEGDDQCQAGIARRIVVNVKRQPDGLRIAEALSALFTDEISPYFRGFKILLSTVPHPADTTSVTDPDLKHDKIVVYYTLGPFHPAGHDTVGDKIVATVRTALPQEDAFDSRAPLFESLIAPGIFWAEEAKYHGMPKASFSESRARPIGEVIKENPEIRDAASFIELVMAKLKQAGVDPDDPHLHLKGRPKPLAPRADAGAQ